MPGPGPRNSITDVEGIGVGNAEDRERLTGVTVVLPDEPAVAAVDVRGGGPGTRETEALGPFNTVERVHAVALSGGSAFGLEAAGGVMDWLAEQGRGYQVLGHRVPIVPAAVIFDLAFGPDQAPVPGPWRRLGYDAARAVGCDFTLGNAGAGLGATAGPLKGGLGTASWQGDGCTVGALAVVNSYGSAVMPDGETLWAWWVESNGEFGGQTPPARSGPIYAERPFDGTHGAADPGANTTLVVVATDAALDRAQTGRLALMAQDGLARALRPVHTPLDGDTVFAISTGARTIADPVDDLTRLGAIAADVAARAIARGVCEAEPLAGWPAYRSRFQT